MPKKYRLIKNGSSVKSALPGRYAGWKKGKIFGRLTCASGLRMKEENRVFFRSWEDAVAAGYRPCRHCHPKPDDRYVRRRGTIRLVRS